MCKTPCIMGSLHLIVGVYLLANWTLGIPTDCDLKQVQDDCAHIIRHHLNVKDFPECKWESDPQSLSVDPECIFDWSLCPARGKNEKLYDLTCHITESMKNHCSTFRTERRRRKSRGAAARRGREAGREAGGEALCEFKRCWTRFISSRAG